jgi:Glycolipid 2-alpha-mannosyltransferase
VRRWTSEITSTPCVYGKIPRDHWFQPDSIDEDKATKARLQMIENNVRSYYSIYFASRITHSHCRSFMGIRKSVSLCDQYAKNPKNI